ncbi:phage minor head protein [Magnetospira sp. QH-2]|uniref:phage minor head protein n=1 Tax=Magnetospira sp. (strain QH-2) TaxID=1288970 RepID=UPI00187DA03D|nr:phage minor head protein [Magnetospira sp. QH-2]
MHLATDGGSINPMTGLLEFWEDKEKKEGTYIWRTVGDNKVRSSHADREGQTFSWDDPPEGGHPGEAENCRCWAEEITNNGCKDIEEALIQVWKEHDALFNENQKIWGEMEKLGSGPIKGIPNSRWT